MQSLTSNPIMPQALKKTLQMSLKIANQRLDPSQFINLQQSIAYDETSIQELIIGIQRVLSLVVNLPEKVNHAQYTKLQQTLQKYEADSRIQRKKEHQFKLYEQELEAKVQKQKQTISDTKAKLIQLIQQNQQLFARCQRYQQLLQYEKMQRKHSTDRNRLQTRSNQSTKSLKRLKKSSLDQSFKTKLQHYKEEIEDINIQMGKKSLIRSYKMFL